MRCTKLHVRQGNAGTNVEVLGTQELIWSHQTHGEDNKKDSCSTEQWVGLWSTSKSTIILTDILISECHLAAMVVVSLHVESLAEVMYVVCWASTRTSQLSSRVFTEPTGGIMSYPHETVVSVLIFSHPVIGTTILVYVGVILKRSLSWV